jgi:hydrogenase-1 operon protein HyaF
MKLETIPVQITHDASGMTAAILMEIAELLEQLANKNVVGAIDLRSLPMSEEDRDCLQDRLGCGEVSVQVDVAGLTEVWETSYAGVWWIRHRGGDNRIVAEEIAVTRIPEILVSPEQDIHAAAQRLITELNSTETSSGEEETLHV